MFVAHFLEMQRSLQIKMKEANPTQGGDPYAMNEEQLAEFITWNCTALMVELGEALGEVGWKPWATSRHVNYPAALHEMVDAWHFFLNMMLAMGALAGIKPSDVAQEFTQQYQRKNAKNLQRQVEGYDGVSSKCPQCHRDLAETSGEVQWEIAGRKFCSSICAERYMNHSTTDEEQ